MEYPVAFNVMEDVGADRRHLVANGLMSAFKKIWVDAWSARMEYILNNIMLALLEFPGSTLLGVNRMLADKEFRNKVVANITDPSVKSFWVDEYAKYTDKFAAEAAPAIQNKVGQFVANPLVRNIIGQAKSTFDIRKMMDEKKILIINLSKGRVGEANANLLGSMLVTKIYLAAMSRADLTEAEMKKAAPFYLYVDEFQSFANESFADILSEARKYNLNLTIAHQYIEQMPEEVRSAVFGNVGTMISFRVGATDAEVLEKEFVPTFTQEDLVNLGMYQIYLKLMIDKVSSRPFSARTMPPIPRPEVSLTSKIIDTSRTQFARPRAQVETEIKDWHLQRFNDNPGAGAGPNGGFNGAPSANRGSAGERGGDRDRASDRGGERKPSGDRGERGGQSGGRSSSESGYRNETRREQGRDIPMRDVPRDSKRAPEQIVSKTVTSRGYVATSIDQKKTLHTFEKTEKTKTTGPNLGLAEAIKQAKLEYEKTEKEKIDKSEKDKETEKQIEKKKAETENDLRQAISLSYLHSEPAKNPREEKKNEKSAKPEQLSALRDMLVGLPKTDNRAGGVPSGHATVSTNTTTSEIRHTTKQMREVPESVLKEVLDIGDFNEDSKN
jgi:hypothetical protein